MLLCSLHLNRQERAELQGHDGEAGYEIAKGDFAKHLKAARPEATEVRKRTHAILEPEQRGRHIRAACRAHRSPP